jgi:hypothetical protein
MGHLSVGMMRMRLVGEYSAFTLFLELDTYGMSFSINILDIEDLLFHFDHLIKGVGCNRLQNYKPQKPKMGYSMILLALLLSSSTHKSLILDKLND